MPAQLRLSGILELKEQLRNLPVQLKGQATAIVLDSAHAAAADIRGQYPLGPPGRRRKGEPITPGNLKKGVRVVVKEIGPLAVAAQVRSAAPHAHLYEFGTEARHYVTKYGRRKAIGKQPGRPVFIPTMIRYRRLMYDKFEVMLEANGLIVKRGEAA